jgi:hypothetical protein
MFLERVAQDYNLNFEELSAKYLECSEAAVKVPRKYTKKPKDVTVVTEAPTPKEPKAKKQCCTAQTSKKDPCKFSALKGEVFCMRHLKQSRGEVPEPKTQKAKKETKTDPVHNHPIDQKPTGPCETCEKYGEPLAPVPVEFEIVTKLSAADRLAAMLAEADSESDHDSDLNGDAIGEEAFEDD